MNHLILSTILLSCLPLLSSANETAGCSADTKSASYYFPPNQLTYESEQALEDHDRDLYTKILSSANEPSFSCNLNERAIRFIWLRTEKNPIIIRIGSKYKDRQFSITAKEIKINDDLKSASVVRHDVRVLTDAERDKLRAMLARTLVLMSDTEKTTSETSKSQWAFEYREENRYYLTTKRSPAANDDATQVGKYILELTRWDFSENDIY